MPFGSRPAIIPRHEISRTTPPTAADATLHSAFAKLAGLVLDMKELADLQAKQVKAKLGPLVTAYREWIDQQEAHLNQHRKSFAGYDEAPGEAIKKCRHNLARIESGLETARGGRARQPEAFPLRRTGPCGSSAPTRSTPNRSAGASSPTSTRTSTSPTNRTWYPFQDRLHPAESAGNHFARSPRAEREVSGSTGRPAVLPNRRRQDRSLPGPVAPTRWACGRLQGKVAGRSGENGIAVLMRYTLRLLTIQQFQRATALICACESIRRERHWNTATTGGAETPFRIGLWVGQQDHAEQDGRTSASGGDQADSGATSTASHISGIGTPHQLTNCPWCGSQIRGRQASRGCEPLPQQGTGRTLIPTAAIKQGKCPFERNVSLPSEGLPVVVVDEEIYRRLPTLLIATVDKFAQMPWKGQVQMLFGKVERPLLTRHGFRSARRSRMRQLHPKTNNGLAAVGQDRRNTHRCGHLIWSFRTSFISFLGRWARWSGCTRRPSTGSAPGTWAARRFGPRWWRPRRPSRAPTCRCGRCSCAR